jgi:chloramphenicol-sensitive protein RarD
MLSLRLATMGLIQFVTPTLQFLFAVVLYHEPFTSAHAVAFGCIWASLALYTSDTWFGARRVLAPERTEHEPPRSS